MANPVAQRSFTSGEVSPTIHARADIAAYREGLQTLRNAYVLRTGGLRDRAGFEYRGTTKSNAAAILVPVDFGTDNTYVLEFGNLYVRFWKAGVVTAPGTTEAWSVSSVAYVAGEFVTHGGSTYLCILANTSGASTEPGVGASWETVWYLLGVTASAIIEWPTAYTLAQVPYLKLAYQYNEVTIVHPSHAPATLTRIANPNESSEWTWVLADIDFSLADEVPGNVAVSGASGSGWGYTVTAYFDAVTESAAGAFVRTDDTTSANLLAFAAARSGDPRTVTWSAVTGAVGYRVYVSRNASNAPPYAATYVLGTTLVDNGSVWYSPFTGSPAVATATLSSAGEYPAAVGAYQQRLLVAGANDTPDVVNASRVADPHDFNVSDPIVDSDALSWRQVGTVLNRIQDFAEVAERLVQFTDRSETVVQGDVDGILRPGEVNPRQVSANGSALYPSPLIVNDTALYVQRQGSIVRDLVPIQAAGFAGSDLTLMSSHLADGYTIVSWCYQQTPDSVVWAVRSDGVLLSLTYVRDLGVLGWARHDTDGTFESVVCVPESGRDAVYAVIKRTINSSTVRYVERMSDRLADTNDLILMDAATVVTAA